MGNSLPQFSCPNCGEYTNQLDDLTGWCDSCSHVVHTSGSNYSSKLELSLASNAGAIEFFLTTSHTNSVYHALSLARQDRPICVVCGNRIKRASRASIFCRQTKECRRYSRRYVYLYTDRDMSKVEALASILTELTGE